MPFTSTDIEETLVIPEGETRTFSPSSEGDTVAFWLVSNYGAWTQLEHDYDRLPLNPTLINYGSIIATNNGAGSFTDMFALFVGSSSFWIGVVVEKPRTYLVNVAIR